MTGGRRVSELASCAHAHPRSMILKELSSPRNSGPHPAHPFRHILVDPKDGYRKSMGTTSPSFSFRLLLHSLPDYQHCCLVSFHPFSLFL